MSDLERMAREAGAFTPGKAGDYWAVTEESLARFADLIRADERERCATFCTPPHSYAMPDVVTGERFEKFMADLAAAIRGN